VPFFSMSGSDFIEMFVGVGPSRVRDLFQQARKQAPSIIFIDEIDAVGRKRGSGGFGGGNDERENTLNQMLVEMDGFKASLGIVVLAGTNRSDILDPALTRPGRFDRQIHVDKPDIADREEIFKVHLKPIKLAEGTDKEEVARRMAALSPGMAGADIANVCNEAAIFAVRRDSLVEMQDFESAVERVIGGLKKQNNLMSPHDRRVIAVHEAGHAVAGWFCEYADPLLKVSIVPRASGALGYAQYMPEDIPLYSKEHLIDRLKVALAGRAAEELFIGRITTGAADDLDKVTKIANMMVAVQGMNKEIGMVSYPPKNDGQPEFVRPYSDETARRIDEQTRLLVDSQYDAVKQLLTEKQELVHKLSERLLKKEVLVMEDLTEILGDRPFGLRESVNKYVDVRRQLDDEKAKAQEKAAQAAEEEAHAKAEQVIADAEKADAEKAAAGKADAGKTASE